MIQLNYSTLEADPKMYFKEALPKQSHPTKTHLSKRRKSIAYPQLVTWQAHCTVVAAPDDKVIVQTVRALYHMGMVQR